MSFVCDSKAEVQWYLLETLEYEQKLFEDIDPLDQDGPVYKIMNVTIEDSGYYYCYGMYDQSERYFFAKVKVEVYGKLINNKF